MPYPNRARADHRHGTDANYKPIRRKKFAPWLSRALIRYTWTRQDLCYDTVAKATGREVYKVDHSMVISKNFGETEKNPAALFDEAKHKD